MEEEIWLALLTWAAVLLEACGCFFTLEFTIKYRVNVSQEDTEVGVIGRECGGQKRGDGVEETADVFQLMIALLLRDTSMALLQSYPWVWWA